MSLALRSVECKFSRRGGTFRTFTLNGKIGKDTGVPVTAELHSRGQAGSGRDIIVLQTNDAGAFFRFTDTYSKMVGGQLALAMEPPTLEPGAIAEIGLTRRTGAPGVPTIS